MFNAPALGGPGLVTDWVSGATGYPGIAVQLFVQAKAVAITLLWSGAVAFAAYKAADRLVGLRVDEEHEREGLDIRSHGESAYDH